MPSNRFLEGGGEMGALTRAYDWSENCLGLPETWPQNLQVTISLLLNSKGPMFLFWGPELICFYNDAYRVILGTEGKHPAVGIRAELIWPEIWEELTSLVEPVLKGNAIWEEDKLIPIFRNGKLEDVYWTFGYSPVYNEDRFVTGVFVTCNETTNTILQIKKLEESEQRFRIMSEATNIFIGVEDAAGKATYFNTAWMNFTGRSQAELLNFGWLDLIHPDDTVLYVDSYKSSFNKREPFSVEMRVRNNQGEYRWLLSTGPPRFSHDNTFEGYITSCIDIDELKRNDERKNDFISMASHELKTPLTSLSGYVQVLLDRVREEKNNFAVLALEKSTKQINKISSLVNGFLNVSRLESGQISLLKEKFSLDQLLIEHIEEARILATTHQIVFLSQDTVIVNADKEKLGTVIINLISNAIKYSDTKTRVEVFCEMRDAVAVVRVKDYGIGIKSDDCCKLFDRYYRVDNLSPHISGFGIGLYLSAEIIQRHKGKIWVESELGKGSTFSFEVPL